MKLISKNKIFLMLGLVLSSAQASATVIGGETAQNLDAISFTESYADGLGRYTVTNELENSLLVGFGVTNIDTTAKIETAEDWGSYVESSGAGNVDDNYFYYEAYTINAENWATQVLYIEESNSDNDGGGFYNPAEYTAQDLYGDIDSFFTNGENTLNWYSANDGALWGGNTWDGFVFYGAQPASSLYGILTSQGQSAPTVFANGITPTSVTTTPDATNVPAPGALGLLALGILGVALGRRRV
ncbi:PEP-CTERM sorting domain-containing protein [Paraglaciecola chathamensis]|uniref:PEP-CTERM sorting domain-containing protein n=1 Tax=Paraglaciecola chathamensis TaxID=368405 RepID=A0ABS0W8V1_9ALTE|nr:PEP-CTERM sorting domain-containing protein [Paraglaciecola chathamensis]MBJ2135197.1 PEP-CTERM sorting domain-containing protein [Paraglaciecola chathamensis]